MRLNGTRHHGFTLVETVVAVGVSSVLMLALGSAVMVASRAVPTGNEPLIRTAEVERAFAFIRADLEEAIGLRLVGTTLYVAVPDRDGNGAGEVITYALEDAWLTRSHNLGPTETVLGPIKGISIIPETVGDAVHAIRLHVPMDNPGSRTLTVRLLNTPELE